MINDMINELYSSVFDNQNNTFNARDHFFTVFFNFCGEEFGKKLDDNFSRYLYRNSYEIHNIGINSNLNNAINKIVNERTNSSDTCYVLAFDYSNGDRSDAVKSCFESVKSILRSSDKALLFLLFPNAVKPDAVNRNVKYIQNLNVDEFRDGAFLNLIVKHSNERRLMEDICGTLLIYTSREKYADFENNWNNISRYIDTITLPELGPEKCENITKKYKPVIWATSTVSFSNVNMLFLCSYMKKLYENRKHIDVYEICKNKVATDRSRTAALVNKLKTAISLIPKNSTDSLAREQSLKDYFTKLYGIDGPKIVELTLKVNLRNENRRESFNETVEHIRGEAKRYDSNDIIRNITEGVTNYIEILNDRGNKLSRGIESILDTRNSNIEQSIDNYIRAYISYCDLLDERELWSYVKTKFGIVSKENDNLKDTCRDLYSSCDNFLRELNGYACVELDDSIAVDSLTAEALNNLTSNSSICESIRRQVENWNEPADATSNPDDFNKFFENDAVNFREKFSYNISNGGCFKACVNQIIGKYLLFDLGGS